MLLLRKSEGEQRMPTESQPDDVHDVRNETTDLLYEKEHKRRRYRPTTIEVSDVLRC